MKKQLNYDIPEKWHSMNETTAYIGVSRDTLVEYVKHGMPYAKIGRTWRFKFSDVDAWLQSYKVNTSIRQTMM